MNAPRLVYKPSWTAADLDEIPAEFHAEVVYGALLVNPLRPKRHQMIIHRLIQQVRPQVPAEWACTFDFDVIFGEEHTRRPDMGVVRLETFDTQPTPAESVGLVVEVVSPSSENTDRLDKPTEYAEAGIPAYWRIETRGALAVVAYELVGDYYLEHTPATDMFTTRQPWPLEIDVPDLGRIGPKR